MAKLFLRPDAIFRHVVKIPVPNSEPTDTEFEFKQRGNRAMQQSIEKHVDDWNADIVLGCAMGWSLEDTFDEESVGLMLDTHPISVLTIVRGYIDEVYSTRKGN